VRVLIIDDASSDDSVELAHRLAARDPRVEVLAHATNKGHIATYNEGIAWARAEYATLLSADDLLAPMALARAIAVMESNPQVGFVAGKLAHFTDEADLADELERARTQGARVAAKIRAGADFIRGICELPINPLAASGIIVRTELQQTAGGYLPELPHSGDLEMWLRLAARADLAIVDAVQCFTRLHATNMRNEYYANRMLEDYRQRRLALELFFERQEAVLGDAGGLSRLAMTSLAREVFWAASGCFDQADEPATAELARLARSMDPSIVGLPIWWKLALKRLLGPRICEAISPWVATVRGARPPLQRQAARSSP
jgi:glycosyltransferase involved in cell wall biosynthesis